jgi:hypothetical protein
MGMELSMIPRKTTAMDMATEQIIVLWRKE